ncbi:Hpt domain-containing protein [Pelagibacterium halotolerans]|uniref:Putative Hpt domain protein n=1 Tax=Pelagibacterium halotolerans (strain DSM 22347 / JCM 15775 / CGMCC 1.7692 / B2) TaxID=1082931 RepID=G4REU1_PELHB|nr:Hpt domain-containing protein [Pelagibacterium halotolerans]AEQ51912.1 putative Hpt domain protein [Pelagibacterium halotolerans B2]
MVVEMMEPGRKGGLDSLRVDRTSRPIDLVHLARQTLGDRALECEVLRMFEKQVAIYFERVSAATDPHEITLGLHTLKGAAQGVGAMALASQARAAEIEFARDGKLDEETLADLGMAVSEVCGYICSIVSD